MAGFNIHSLDGTFVGHSFEEDALIAAKKFFAADDVFGFSLVSIKDNDDGSFTAIYGDQTIVLKPT